MFDGNADLANNFLLAVKMRVEKHLRNSLACSKEMTPTLHDAMAYAVLSEGKRIRPLLTYAACTAMGGSLELSDGAACAVELLHTYSLVHDDLPPLDNDTLRRGLPTVHIAYGEGMAVIAGDCLQALAFESLVKGDKPEAPVKLGMVQCLVAASGAGGIAGGQSLDLGYVGRHPSLVELAVMQRLKTGALIEASVELGVLASLNEDSQKHEALKRYSRIVGEAFQIRDDILDVVGDEKVIGKPIGSDSKQMKPTYASQLGCVPAVTLSHQLMSQALDALTIFGKEADPLREIARFVVARDN